MEDFWARYIEPSGRVGPDYWSYFAERLVDHAIIPNGATVLDVGTYDGNVLFKAVRQAGVRSRGVGIDIYAGGLKDGLKIATQHAIRDVAFAQMDASNLGFLPETYDSVLANFVGWDYCFDFYLMELTAPDRRLAEIMRILKPGGQVGIGFWIEQSDIEWIVEAFRRYLPESQQATSERMTAYSKEHPEGYETILCESGFHEISFRMETATFVSPNTETWWMQMKQAAREYFKAMPQLEDFKEQIYDDLKDFQSSKGVHFDKSVGYAFARKL